MTHCGTFPFHFALPVEASFTVPQAASNSLHSKATGVCGEPDPIPGAKHQPACGSGDGADCLPLDELARWLLGVGVEICVSHPTLREGRDTKVSHLGEEQHVSGPGMDSIVARGDNNHRTS